MTYRVPGDDGPKPFYNIRLIQVESNWHILLRRVLTMHNRFDWRHLNTTNVLVEKFECEYGLATRVNKHVAAFHVLQVNVKSVRRTDAVQGHDGELVENAQIGMFLKLRSFRSIGIFFLRHEMN